MRNQSEFRTYKLRPENNTTQMKINCQLQQIAAMATRITYLPERSKSAEKALRIAIEMMDED